MTTSRSVDLRMRKASEKVVENIKTHILCSITYFRKSCRLWNNVEKYGRSRQATQDNMAHAHCMLDTYGYKHTHRICNTYCLSTATTVARKRLSVTLYVHCVLFRCIFTSWLILFSSQINKKRNYMSWCLLPNFSLVFWIIPRETRKRMLADMFEKRYCSRQLARQVTCLLRSSGYVRLWHSARIWTKEGLGPCEPLRKKKYDYRKINVKNIFHNGRCILRSRFKNLPEFAIYNLQVLLLWIKKSTRHASSPYGCCLTETPRKVENQHLVSTSRQCSSTSVRFGQGFLGKEQSDSTEASRILTWPEFSWYLPVPLRLKSALKVKSFLILLTSLRMRRKSWKNFHKIASRNVSNTFTVAGRSVQFHKMTILKDT